MFTGIVSHTAPVLRVTDSTGLRRLRFACPWPDARLGESIAVNGCCLTIASLTDGEMEFDAVQQTLGLTNLGRLRELDEVHFERALLMGDRLDGHFVQGHIDGTADLLSFDGARIALRTPPNLSRFIMPQGSVALDGVSLTIAAVKDDQFEVALIPTTLRQTALGRRTIGWPMNLEADILTKTIVFSLERRQTEETNRVWTTDRP